MMVATHVSFNSRLAWLLHLPLPISSAADWFVMLSGVAIGIRSRRKPGASMVPRALLIYVIHCAFTLAVLFIHGWSGALQAPDIHSLGGTARSLWLVLTLQLQPLSYMNILPLYVIFLLAAPLLLTAMRRGLTVAIVAAAAVVWALAQQWPTLLPLPDPNIDGISFSLAAWFFPFVLGLALGSCWPRASIRLRSWGVVLPLAALSAALFTASRLQRSSEAALHVVSPWQWRLLTRKQTWAPAEALFSVVVLCLLYAVVSWWNERMPADTAARGRTAFAGTIDRALLAFGSMGRQSLRCFVVHLPLSLLAIALGVPYWSRAAQELSVIGGLGICYVAAQVTWPRSWTELMSSLDRVTGEMSAARSA